MSKDNGKDKGDGFVEVQGNAVPARGAKKPPKLAARAKDRHLPGMEPKTIPAVHKAIEEYVEARDHRMQLTKVEVEKKAILLHEMKKAGIPVYNVDGHEASLEVDEQVKARLREPEIEEEEPVGTFVEPAKKAEASAAPAKRGRKGGAPAEARA